MIKKYLITFFISMVPIAELRIAVPVGVSFGLKWYYVVAMCMIGNMIPVPFIYFFARKILEWGADKPVIGKFFSWCLKKGHSGGEKLQQKAGKSMFWALLLFVGIPLPGTGAWTGALIASLMEFDIKKASAAIGLGILTAAVIVNILTHFGLGYLFGIG